MIVLVWVLTFFPGSGSSAVVIDNIASQEECVALGNKLLRDTDNFGSAHCYHVRKFAPKA